MTGWQYILVLFAQMIASLIAAGVAVYIGWKLSQRKRAAGDNTPK
jgi:hypothetical protein